MQESCRVIQASSSGVHGNIHMFITGLCVRVIAPRHCERAYYRCSGMDAAVLSAHADCRLQIGYFRAAHRFTLQLLGNRLIRVEITFCDVQ